MEPRSTTPEPVEDPPSARRRPGGDKRTSLAQAAEIVRDGDHVAIGGCLYSRTPWASLLELLRAGRTDLTLSRSLMCYEAELFLVRAAASTLVTSWVGIGLPWGIPKVFRRYVEEGRARYDEWSHLSLGLRYLAGSMGVPFLPTRSLLGSDLLKSTGSKEMDDPFTGQRVALVPALVPDVALIHVHRADPLGNAQIDGPPYMDREIARAAHRVIVTAEEIVSTDAISRSADRTAIPHFLVDAVVEVPFGSFPHECYGLYEASFDHFDEYVQLVDESGAEGVESYLRTYVDEAGSFEGFLERIGDSVLAEQQRRARELVPG
jgi:glutaconate CoA-transferase, subunit A